MEIAFDQSTITWAAYHVKGIVEVFIKEEELLIHGIFLQDVRAGLDLGGTVHVVHEMVLGHLLKHRGVLSLI